MLPLGADEQAEHLSPTARLNREGQDPSMPRMIRSILVQKSHPSSTPKTLACPLTSVASKGASCSYLLCSW